VLEIEIQRIITEEQKKLQTQLSQRINK